MRLVYVDSDNTPVKVGDRVRIGTGLATVTHITKPHKPSSTGRVGVKTDAGDEAEYFPVVIDAFWIEREDRDY